LRRSATAVLLLTAALAGCGGSSQPETAGPKIASPVMRDAASHHCDHFASPRPGAVAALVAQLKPGQRGCLRGGTYRGDVSIRRGGRPGAPIRLTSAPGERATIDGVLWVADTANDVEISALTLNGANARQEPSPQINGDRVTLKGNDITNRHTGICVILGGGFTHYGVAVDPVVKDNRIHDCGRLPRTNHDHGIYVEGTRGAKIVDNLIYGNADYGVHLYPNADGSLVARNVIEGNGGGVIVAGASGGEYPRAYASDDNVIEDNVISGSRSRPDLETSWDGLRGRGNVARRNCLGPATGSLTTVDAGLALDGNVSAQPGYVNRAAGDLRQRAGSPCAFAGPRP
jgi:parallel beta-helix repeat protein